MTNEQYSAGKPTLRIPKDDSLLPESAGKETKRLITPTTIDEALTVDIAPDEEFASLDLLALHDPKEQLKAKYLQSAADLFLFNPTRLGAIVPSSQFPDQRVTDKAQRIYFEALDKILNSVFMTVCADKTPLGAMNVLDSHIVRYAPTLRGQPKTYDKLVNRFKKSYLDKNVLNKGIVFFLAPFSYVMYGPSFGKPGGLAEMAQNIKEYYPDTLPQDTNQPTKAAFNKARLLLTEQLFSERLTFSEEKPELKRLAKSVFSKNLKDAVIGYLQKSGGIDAFRTQLPHDLPQLASGDLQNFNGELPQVFAILGEQQGTWHSFTSAFSEQFRKTVGIDMREKLKKQTPNIVNYEFNP